MRRPGMVNPGPNGQPALVLYDDCLAERGEFELPVPISEQPDENMMSGSAAPRRSVWDRLRLKRLVGLYGRQHSKETLPSCAMNDIATDVAAAIQ
jgi:hypothetical protein